MFSFCLKCLKNAESKSAKAFETKNGRIMLLSKCSVCNSKKLKFLSKKSRGSLSSLRIRTPLNQIPMLGPILF